MTTLFPSINDQELRPIAEPLGRFMLAYNRALHAVAALAFGQLPIFDEDGEPQPQWAELEAARIANDIENIPKRIRRLCQDKLSPSEFEQLNNALACIKREVKIRNRLVHAEWWQVENGKISTRNVYRDKIEHDEPIDVKRLSAVADELDAIACDLDHLDDTLRRRASHRD
jgi:hypothetical protein